VLGHLADFSKKQPARDTTDQLNVSGEKAANKETEKVA
jgi:hypothetical protein